MFFFRFVSAGLAGFINLPLSKFEEWSEKLTGDNAILDAEKDVVILCHHGMRCGGRYGIRIISHFVSVEPTAARDERVLVEGVTYS